MQVAGRVLAHVLGRDMRRLWAGDLPDGAKQEIPGGIGSEPSLVNPGHICRLGSQPKTTWCTVGHFAGMRTIQPRHQFRQVRLLAFRTELCALRGARPRISVRMGGHCGARRHQTGRYRAVVIRPIGRAIGIQTSGVVVIIRPCQRGMSTPICRSPWAVQVCPLTYNIAFAGPLCDRTRPPAQRER
jgi:hypothetical protein